MSTLYKGYIDLSKIKMDQVKEGKNGGKYINIDIWLNETPDKFGNEISIKQNFKVNDKFEGVYVGNASTKLNKSTEDLPF